MNLPMLDRVGRQGVPITEVTGITDGAHTMVQSVRTSTVQVRLQPF